MQISPIASFVSSSGGAPNGAASADAARPGDDKTLDAASNDASQGLAFAEALAASLGAAPQPTPAPGANDPKAAKGGSDSSTQPILDPTAGGAAPIAGGPVGDGPLIGDPLSGAPVSGGPVDPFVPAPLAPPTAAAPPSPRSGPVADLTTTPVATPLADAPRAAPAPDALTGPVKLQDKPQALPISPDSTAMPPPQPKAVASSDPAPPSSPPNAPELGLSQPTVAAAPAQALAAADTAPPPPPGRSSDKAVERADPRIAAARGQAPSAAQTPSRGATVAADAPFHAVSPQGGGGGQKDGGASGKPSGDAPLAAQTAGDAPHAAEGQPMIVAAAPTTTALTAAHTAHADQTTIAHLTSAIVDNLASKITRFDLELSPQGLGKVGVKVEIDSSGAVSAALRFDNPHAASELKGRADELRSALQQAGFNVSDSGLSFAFSGGRDGFAQARQQAPILAGRAFAATADAADEAASNVIQATDRFSRRAAGGFDIRI